MLVIGLGAGYLLAPSQTGNVGGQGHTMADGSMMGQNIDQHFIVQMIPHHEGAIAMAQVALSRSKRSEVLSLAQGIIEAQTKEINDMKSWYQTWYASAPPSGDMGMHMEGMTGNTDELARISDAEFDREFMAQMIIHHEMAIMMAGMLDSTTERSEMKTLADQIITSQSREIEMMRSWLEAWY